VKNFFLHIIKGAGSVPEISHKKHGISIEAKTCRKVADTLAWRGFACYTLPIFKD
jgi:hypothetical protein